MEAGVLWPRVKRPEHEDNLVSKLRISGAITPLPV
jgi:hypothetical protein